MNPLTLPDAIAEIDRLRAALTGCVSSLNFSAQEHRRESNEAYARYCEKAAKLAQETLDGK